jgi:hypothetical protein
MADSRTGSDQSRSCVRRNRRQCERSDSMIHIHEASDSALSGAVPSLRLRQMDGYSSGNDKQGPNGRKRPCGNLLAIVS